MKIFYDIFFFEIIINWISFTINCEDLTIYLNNNVDCKISDGTFQFPFCDFYYLANKIKPFLSYNLYLLDNHDNMPYNLYPMDLNNNSILISTKYEKKLNVNIESNTLISSFNYSTLIFRNIEFKNLNLNNIQSVFALRNTTMYLYVKSLKKK